MKIKQVKGFEKYKVSDCGKVFSARNGKELKAQVNDGYFVVKLFDGNKYHFKRVHRLVAEAFIENPNDLPLVHHIDHNRQNNKVTNLEWVTHSYNSSESSRQYPERWKNNASINEATARKICEMIEQSIRNKEIAEYLEIGIDTVKKIRNGKSWTNISKDYKMTKSTRSVSEETVRWICRMILEGCSNSEIYNESHSKGVTESLIKHIKGKRTWRWLTVEYF